jgi:predicted dehydrogenase
MQAYLELIANGRMNFDALIDRVVPIDAAPATYVELAKADDTLPLGVLIHYPDPQETEEEPARVTLRGHRPAPGERINYALVGAGAFGTAMLVPQMKKRADRYFLRGIVSRTGTQGSNFARDNQVEVLTSDLDAVLNDPGFQLVVIATRHHEHADQVVRSLAAGKHVFVEKPLAISWEELERVVSVHSATVGEPLVMVGFNRRFFTSPAVAEGTPDGTPIAVDDQYRLNAGYIALDHWVHGARRRRRTVGEACHIYDVFRFLAGAAVRTVAAAAIDPHELPYARNDNFAATITTRTARWRLWSIRR